MALLHAVTSAAILGAAYNVGGQNFPEFQPNASIPSQRVGADVVAFAVSGGRSVLNGVWKPPVKPRMFGVVSAYDGRSAQPYPGKSQRPGRIVCDSTWHHFVNINLDGTGSGRTGLGTGSGAGFVPSPALEKIYAYYRNIVSWLQPANRIWCRIFWDLVAVRMNAALLEELLDLDRCRVLPRGTRLSPRTMLRRLERSLRKLAAQEGRSISESDLGTLRSAVPAL